MEQSSANMGKAYINMLRGGLGFWNDYSLNNIRPACRSEAYMQLRYKILPFAEDPDKYINTKIKDKTLINKACHKLEQMMHDDESNTASYIKSLYDITSGNKDLFDDYAIIRFDFTSTISAIARSTQELLTPDAFFSELLNKHEFYAYSTNPKNKLNLTAGMDGLFMTLKARLYNMQSMMTASVENNKQSAPNSFAEQAMNYTHLSQGQIIAMCDMLTAQLISIKETVPVSIESALDDLWTICNCNRVMELIMGKNCISLINTMYEDDEKSKNDILWSIQNMLNSKNMPDDVKTKSSARQYVKHATMLQLKLEPCN